MAGKRIPRHHIRVHVPRLLTISQLMRLVDGAVLY